MICYPHVTMALVTSADGLQCMVVNLAEYPHVLRFPVRNRKHSPQTSMKTVKHAATEGVAADGYLGLYKRAKGSKVGELVR